MTLNEREIDGVVVLELQGKIMGGPDATVLNDKLPTPNTIQTTEFYLRKLGSRAPTPGNPAAWAD